MSKKVIWWVIPILVLTFGLCGAYAGSPAKAKTEAAYAPDEVLVKFKGVAGAQDAPMKFNKDKAAAFAAKMPGPAQSALATIGGTVVKMRPSAGVMKVQLAKGASVTDAVASLQKSGAVEYAEPNYKIRAAATPPPWLPPTDVLYSNQWAIFNGTYGAAYVPGADIDALHAWELRTSGLNTLVVLLDTGVETLGIYPPSANADIMTNLWRNLQEVYTNNFDDDGNGYIDDIYGIDTVYGEQGFGTAQTLGHMNIQDRNGHGTAVAGIIGALGRGPGTPGLGIAGLNWRAKMMVLKCLGDDGIGTVDDVAEAIDYALAIKSRDDIKRMVLNCSWGMYYFSRALYDTMKKASDANCLIVAAAGDGVVWPAVPVDVLALPVTTGVDTNPAASPNDNMFYPAGFKVPNDPNLLANSLGYLDAIISVGAYNSSDAIPSFANFGNASVDLFAPGAEIVTTYLGGWTPLPGAYGSSMAAAHVTGTAALLWSWENGASFDNQPRRIKSMILNGAISGIQADVNPPSAYPYTTRCVTEGRLNVNNAFRNPYSRPSIYSDTPNIRDIGQTTTILGQYFTGATLSFLPFTPAPLFPLNPAVVLPPASYVVNNSTKVTATVSSAWPRGHGRLQLTTAQGTSRGAWFTNVTNASPTPIYHTTQGHALAAWAQYGNDIFIISGRTNLFPNSPQPVNEKFSLTTGTSNILPNGIPVPVDYASAAYAKVPGAPPPNDDRIYVVGGASGVTSVPPANPLILPANLYTQIQIYQISTDTWTSSGPGVVIPGGRLAPAVVSNPVPGLVYIFGGWTTPNTYSTTAFVYNSQFNTITPIAPMPLGVAGASAVLRSDGKIWVMGGTTGGAAITNVQVYDPATNTWAIPNPPLITGRQGGVGNLTGANTVPLDFCGVTVGAAYFPIGPVGVTDAEAWRGLLNFNQEVVGLPSRYTPAGGRVGNDFYVVGGWDPTTSALTNDVFRVAIP